MKVYAFDVDDTLEFAKGPVKGEELAKRPRRVQEGTLIETPRAVLKLRLSSLYGKFAESAPVRRHEWMVDGEFPLMTPEDAKDFLGKDGTLRVALERLRARRP